MMVYSIPWDIGINAPSTTIVIRDADGAFIPTDSVNTDYIAYLAWVSQGGVTDIATGPYVDPSVAISESAKALALSQAKSSLASGDTQGAITQLLKIVENLT
jgi:hypothetical protein